MRRAPLVPIAALAVCLLASCGGGGGGGSGSTADGDGTSSAPAAGTVTVGGFRDLAVAQRRAGSGRIALAGTASAEVAAVEARAVRADDGSAVTPWTRVAPAADGRWEGDLAGVPQGGWYRVEARAAPAGTAVAASAERFGVGAIVACIGQSNMANMFASREATTPASPLARMRGLRARGGAAESAVTGDGAVRLANGIADGLGIPVLLLDYAVAGQSIATWNDDDASLWTDFAAAVAAVGGDIELVIWQQGETDAVHGVGETWYRAQLDLLRTRLHALVPGRDPLPILCTVLGRGNLPSPPAGASEGFDAVRAAQLAWSRTTPDVAIGACATDAEMADGLHWMPASYRLIGDRLAQSALRALDPARHPGGAGGARIVDVVRSGAQLRVRVRHDRGGMLRGRSAATGIHGFVVDRGAGSTPLGVAAAAIDGADTVLLTLAADPGGPVRVRYLVGMNPGVGRLPGNVVVDDAPDAAGRRGLPVLPEPAGVTSIDEPHAAG